MSPRLAALICIVALAAACAPRAAGSSNALDMPDPYAVVNNLQTELFTI